MLLGFMEISKSNSAGFNRSSIGPFRSLKGKKRKKSPTTCQQPTILFSQNKLANNNQPTKLFSQNKSAPTTGNEPNEQAAYYLPQPLS
jgi:hypothetical protein